MSPGAPPARPRQCHVETDKVPYESCCNQSYHNHVMARYAAVDIGSNSVRLEVAEVIGGSPTRILASDRQVTRLGASVFHAGRVSPEALDLLCGVLAGMSAIWKRYDVLSIRAVATAAVREARNQQEFLARSSA